MKKNLEQIINNYKDNIVKTTSEFIQKKSVETQAKKNMPFGQGVNDSLEFALHKADYLGFSTKNVDGYAGYAETGKGDELLGILCHLDVVPAGDNWSYPPFGGEIHNNKIYGRGSIDNKGPAVAVLFALKAIKEANIKLNKRVRLIFGTDEESGWEGIKYYLRKEEEPDFSFSPDANFPVIHAEKGILLFDLIFKFSQNKEDPEYKIIVEEINGGNAPNMVPDYCEAHLKLQNKNRLIQVVEESEFNLDLEEKNNNSVILKSYGKSAHGSLPEEGENAISNLLVFLNSLDTGPKSINNFIEFYANNIGLDYYGQGMGCNFKDDVSGNLIFNTGLIKLDQKSAKITVNIRYPVTYKAEKIYQAINKKIKNKNIKLEKKEHHKPLYLPKDNSYVKKLIKVYQDITGERAKPIAIGGGTYARAVKNGVAFGAVFPDEPKLAHKKDEYIDIDSLIKATKIYARAIICLCNE